MRERELLRRSWGRLRRLSDTEACEAVRGWQEALGVTQRVSLTRVARSQVTGAEGRRGCSLVGVVYDALGATIYHTRALTAEDVVHELLHVRHPDWSESRVVEETERLLPFPPSRSRQLPTGPATPPRTCPCEAQGQGR